MIRVLLADDHQLVRTGFRVILEIEDDIEVVGEAADGAQAVDLAGHLKPDVVLMDVEMPGMDGLEATRRITAAAAQDTSRLEDLTPREHEVLVLLAAGATNAEIATELFLGETTVKTHVSRVLMKLGARDRTQAVVFAYELGVVRPGG